MKMEWKIPLTDIDLGQEEMNAIEEVLKSKWLTMGEVTRKFEADFAEYHGVKHAIAVTNCTAALHMAHQALGIKEGDEVICPSLTFVATANSILYVGATPVFADIRSLEDLNISPDSIIEKITPRTRAITVMHYGGYPCDMDMIIQIAKKHDLYIVEDAAHAPGAVFNGKKAGTIGDVGCFSFFSNKNMTTGEGGMIVTDNDDLADKLKLIRSHGMTSLTMDRHKGHAYSYDVIDFGFNYRMDEIRAAMGIVQLKKLKKNIELRQIIVKLYRKKLNGIKEIKIPFDNYSQESSYHIFPIILSLGINRKKFIDMMREKGIQTSIHYPPVHLFSFYRDKFGFEKGMLPVTEEVCNREVTLPLYPHMDTEAIDYIAGAIDSIIRSKEAVRLD